VRELDTEHMAAEDIAFAAQLEALREALATGEGEPGGVGAEVAGGAFKTMLIPVSHALVSNYSTSLLL
jgi:hypothetical protein